jgi:hypothetical protein
MRPLCALYAPFMRPLCALYAPFMRPLCALLLSFSLNSQVVHSQRCLSEMSMQEIHSNPKLLREYNKIEQLVKDYKKKYGSPNANQRLVDPNGLITIPVVFHVIYRPNHSIGIGTNISLAQIQSQIDVLNEDFSRTNSDAANTPIPFQSKASNPQFAFKLACVDPNGNSTNGVTRTAAAQNKYWFWQNEMKRAITGGHDAWPTDRYLNVWVVPALDDLDISTGVTQPITLFSSDPNTDGIAIRSDCTGRGPDFSFKEVTIYDTFNREIRNFKFNLGRTLTHEIGHWLNLVHIWGPNNGGVLGQTCSDSDECDDTPNQLSPSDYPYYIKHFPDVSCNNGPDGDMFMNFMDYSDDKDMNLFTNGQKIKMRAVFQPGGPRQGFIDNYFKLVFSGYQNCIEGFYFVASPFCEAAGNINWSISGPAYTSNISGFSTYVNPWSGANGTAVLTATWNNLTSDISIPIGYAIENSTYTPNYPSSGYIPLRVNQVHETSFNRFTYGQVAFTGATGQAKNWRFLTSSSNTTTMSGTGNSFWIRFTQAGALATIRAEIPTICGDRSVDYSFTTSGSSAFSISPNPVSNNITIRASNAVTDANALTTEIPEYDVQIFTRYNQLMKKAKCHKGNGEITIDISTLSSNQLYTVQLITATDIQTISFFKE